MAIIENKSIRVVKDAETTTINFKGVISYG